MVHFNSITVGKNGYKLYNRNKNNNLTDNLNLRLYTEHMQFSIYSMPLSVLTQNINLTSVMTCQQHKWFNRSTQVMHGVIQSKKNKATLNNN